MGLNNSSSVSEGNEKVKKDWILYLWSGFIEIKMLI